MSQELLQIVLPLTFLGALCLVGQIIVQSHRDRANADTWPHPPRRSRPQPSEKLEIRRS